MVIYDYPPLMDGGIISAPRVAFYNLQGQWDVENYGTPPDIEVDFDPAEWRKGRDPQLERALQVALELLKKNPPPKIKRPAYPNYYSTKPVAGGNGKATNAATGKAVKASVQR